MNNKLVCNYAVIRFMPYPETHEFANIGVILMCPELHFIDFKIETQRRERITAFFPELDENIFKIGRGNFRQEMERIRAMVNGGNGAEQLALNIQQEDFKNFFKHVVKPREAIFRFSDIGTTLADDPKRKLDDLFRFFVERNFAQHLEYQENLMARALSNRFRAVDVLKHYKTLNCGDNIYHVPLPFVHEVQGTMRRAIKPLDLAKKDPTRITEHGDQWYMRINRLERMHKLPEHLLFAVREPKDGINLDACRQVCQQLAEKGAAIISYGNTEGIIDFAKAL